MIRVENIQIVDIGNIHMDIIAPLYWWEEFNDYKTSVNTGSYSAMWRFYAKKFTLDDFSHEHLDIRTREVLENIIDVLNDYRELYINYDPDDFEIKGCPSKQLILWQMIDLLPSCYNQRRTIKISHDILATIYQHYRGYWMDEWREFCKIIEGLLYKK